MESCFFPARVGIFPFVVNITKVFFPIFTSTWRVIKYVSRQGKNINRRNESTNIMTNMNNMVGIAKRNSSFKILLTVLRFEAIPQKKGKPLMFCTQGFILKQKDVSVLTAVNCLSHR